MDRNRLLCVDETSALFETGGMNYCRISGEFRRIRDYAQKIIADSGGFPGEEGRFLEQQISEIIKNAVVHGSRNDKNKKIAVWYLITSRSARLIVEDQGSGFAEIEKWNEFYRTRCRVLESPGENDIEKYLSWHSYLGTEETGSGGVALIAAVEYWNGGIVFNKKKNKVALLRKFSD